MDRIENLFKFKKTERAIKELAYSIHIIGIIESIAFLIAGIVVAVAIDFEEWWWTMFAGFYLAAVTLMIHDTISTLIFSYAEIVEHTKKQTELMKVIAVK